MPDLPRKPLDIALDLASRGDKAAARQFYQLLLNTPLQVIERFQLHNMTDSPKYPDPFLNMLAVQSEDRSIVPVFSSPSHVRDWCGLDLKVRTLTLSEAIVLLPTDWWIVVNPGQEAYKEVSPWELERLRSGTRGIEEILEELYEDEPTSAVSLGPVAPSEHPQVYTRVKGIAASTPGLQSVFAALEIWGDGKNPDDRRFIFAIESVEERSRKLDERPHLVFERAIVPQLIGEGAVRVVDLAQCPPFLSEALRSFAPLYVRPRRFFSYDLIARIKQFVFRRSAPPASRIPLKPHDGAK
ncbi:MAG: SseB family protein [Bdellovibrionota bacterium]|nr:MAG: SseB family protein [Bdellovibrionota bacterium]